MTMTIDDSNRLCSWHFTLYLMRIGESSIVRWQTSWLRANILLIHLTDKKNSRFIKKLFQLDMSLTFSFIEQNHIHELRLHKDTVCDDYRYIDVFQKLLHSNHTMNNWYINHNSTEFFTRIRFLLWCDWRYSKHSLIQTIRRLRMKASILQDVNESHFAFVIWCWEDWSCWFNWADCELSISWKKRLNSQNIYRRNINHNVLKKWEIQKESRIEQFSNARYILKQLHIREQRRNKEYNNHSQCELSIRRYQTVRYNFNCEYRFDDCWFANQQDTICTR